MSNFEIIDSFEAQKQPKPPFRSVEKDGITLKFELCRNYRFGEPSVKDEYVLASPLTHEEKVQMVHLKWLVGFKFSWEKWLELLPGIFDFLNFKQKAFCEKMAEVLNQHSILPNELHFVAGNNCVLVRGKDSKLFESQFWKNFELQYRFYGKGLVLCNSSGDEFPSPYPSDSELVEAAQLAKKEVVKSLTMQVNERRRKYLESVKQLQIWEPNHKEKIPAKILGNSKPKKVKKDSRKTSG